jgi:hypothetical protein
VRCNYAKPVFQGCTLVETIVNLIAAVYTKSRAERCDVIHRSELTSYGFKRQSSLPNPAIALAVVTEVTSQI